MFTKEELIKILRLHVVEIVWKLQKLFKLGQYPKKKIMDTILLILSTMLYEKNSPEYVQRQDYFPSLFDVDTVREALRVLDEVEKLAIIQGVFDEGELKFMEEDASL